MNRIDHRTANNDQKMECTPIKSTLAVVTGVFMLSLVLKGAEKDRPFFDTADCNLRLASVWKPFMDKITDPVMHTVDELLLGLTVDSICPIVRSPLTQLQESAGLCYQVALISLFLFRGFNPHVVKKIQASLKDYALIKTFLVATFCLTYIPKLMKDMYPKLSYEECDTRIRNAELGGFRADLPCHSYEEFQVLVCPPETPLWMITVIFISTFVGIYSLYEGFRSAEMIVPKPIREAEFKLHNWIAKRIDQNERIY